MMYTAHPNACALFHYVGLYFDTLLAFNNVFKDFDERKSEFMNLWEYFEKQILPL